VARDFTANTANYMSLGANAIGPLIDGAASFSVHFRVVFDTFHASGGAVGRDMVSACINSTTAGFAISHLDPSGISGPRLRCGARSVSTDTYRVLDSSTDLSTGTEYGIGCVYQISADNIVIYLNGASDGSGISGTWANASYTNGTPTAHDGLGAAFGGTTPVSADRQLDGRLSEVAIWAGDIGAAGFASLGADRVSPLLVRPELLVSYFPLLGKYSPEIDVVGGLAGTITGTVAAADHPSVFTANARRLYFGTAAASAFQAAWARGSNVILGAGAP